MSIDGLLEFRPVQLMEDGSFRFIFATARYGAWSAQEMRDLGIDYRAAEDARAIDRNRWFPWLYAVKLPGQSGASSWFFVRGEEDTY